MVIPSRPALPALGVVAEVSYPGARIRPADDAFILLNREFEAAEGTFLLGLRGAGLVWDRVTFSRMEQAMRTACKSTRAMTSCRAGWRRGSITFHIS
ncbi:hypothetical protein GCM10012284_59850 [Mangrovihabitans endophyticus]|uniref:Uncharacterized protein n=1 Tax=Mangrovihabitans endophyticus TaxID=1751298 RepID=A0A8J3C7W5_9ACTN|nr:hypothetical protein GCM10012284_59850 [Mangrovihabitans endophyticus]